MKRVALTSLAAITSAMITVPAFSQDHGSHAGQGQMTSVPTATPTPTPARPADPHAGHVMPQADATPSPQADGMQDMDHEGMDHESMDESEAAAPSPAPELETAPPPAAGSGPPRAADAIWGADAMRASRRDLQQTHGDFPVLWFQADRLEAQTGDGTDGYLWDLQGYYGGTTSRFWFKSEGEGSFGGAVDDAEFQALYARGIAPFFDLQAGVRQDFAGPDTTYAVLGIQGLAPYMFEVDAALFLSHRGDLTARIEAELDQRITQRLIVQPRAEVNVSAQDVPQLGMGAGFDSIDVGVRLRYEVVREFAPYIGIEQQWRTGRGADFARAAGDDPSATRIVVGVRAWF